MDIVVGLLSTHVRTHVMTYWTVTGTGFVSCLDDVVDNAMSPSDASAAAILILTWVCKKNRLCFCSRVLV